MGILSRSPRSPSGWLIGLVLAGSLCVPAAGYRGPAAGTVAAPTEYQVKAAFLYSFASFVEWPEGAFPRADSPLVIGIAGRDPFGSILDEGVAGRTIRNRGVVVRRLRDTDDFTECHVLFVGLSDERRLGTVLERVGRSHVLTVGETGRFAQQGGVINFYMDQRKVRFEINVRAAERAGLSLRSDLLSLARIVRP